LAGASSSKVMLVIITMPFGRQSSFTPRYNQPVLHAANAGKGGGHSGHHQQEEIATICVLSLAEKGLSPEEIIGWCEQQQGYVSHHHNERLGGVFARFSSARTAERALKGGADMGIEWARRNLDDSTALKHAPVPQYAPVAAAPMGGFGAPAKRQRVAAGPIDTIAVVALKEKGLAHDQLQEFFEGMHGFSLLQFNPRIGSLFVKFQSSAEAETAIGEAAGAGIHAEWARRNLDH